MKHMAKRLSAAILVALCLMNGGDAHASQNAPQTAAQAHILMDAESGRILAAGQIETELPIASTTKIMTALVALEHGTLSDTATVKEKHLKEGSSMYLRAGEVLTLEELLYGLLLPSGNDAAECIADHCGGSVEQFVAWMNEKATQLGLTHTAFSNPSGLDAAGHYSCALDMARLAAYAMCEPTFARIVSTRSATVGERELSNHNKLLMSLSGCVGLKTGYTGAAGRTLVTCCERDGMRIIAVTLNDRADWTDHAALYDYGFSAFARKKAAARDEVYALVPLRGGEETSVGIAPEKDVYYPLAQGETLTFSAELPDALTAPVAAGQQVGTLHISLDGTIVASVALVCRESVAAAQETHGLWERIRAWGSK